MKDHNLANLKTSKPLTNSIEKKNSAKPREEGYIKALMCILVPINALLVIYIQKINILFRKYMKVI